jgi:hypothetical protein
MLKRTADLCTRGLLIAAALLSHGLSRLSGVGAVKRACGSKKKESGISLPLDVQRRHDCGEQDLPFCKRLLPGGVIWFFWGAPFILRERVAISLFTILS